MIVSVVPQLPIHFVWVSLFWFFIHRFLTMSAPRGTRSAQSTHTHTTHTRHPHTHTQSALSGQNEACTVTSTRGSERGRVEGAAAVVLAREGRAQGKRSPVSPAPPPPPPPPRRLEMSTCPPPPAPEGGMPRPTHLLAWTQLWTTRSESSGLNEFCRVLPSGNRTCTTASVAVDALLAATACNAIMQTMERVLALSTIGAGDDIKIYI
jgi:hypothetical protein